MSRLGSAHHAASTHSRAFHLPRSLQPVLRAYILGYLSAVSPRLLTLAAQHTTKLRRQTFQHDTSLVAAAIHILRSGFHPRRFPTFCAVLVAGTLLLHKPLDKVIEKLGAKLSKTSRLRLARFLCSFLAGWFGLKLLHGKGTAPRRHSTATRTKEQEEARCRQMAGRTLDLTLFAMTRAADVIVGELWSQRRTRRQAVNRWTKIDQIAEYLADPLVFAASCALIMWSWFYHPGKLPRGYHKWITSAAQVDERLIQALRRFRSGALVYGKETGQADLIGDMCVDYGLPRSWGDPATKTPFPCEIVHMGCGPSCEYHALSRFFGSWKWSMFTYLPLGLVLQLRKASRGGSSRGSNSSNSNSSSSSSNSRRSSSSIRSRQHLVVVGVVAAIKSASRSSAFLAMYITLFYYGVCLARNRLGPYVLARIARFSRFADDDDAARIRHHQLLDSHVCVAAGCLLCGWSVLLETPARRKDMSLFVAPRALGTLVPRQYPRHEQWRETLCFALSTAVVFTCVLEKPWRIRGVFGAVLEFVVRE